MLSTLKFKPEMLTKTSKLFIEFAKKLVNNKCFW